MRFYQWAVFRATADHPPPVALTLEERALCCGPFGSAQLWSQVADDPARASLRGLRVCPTEIVHDLGAPLVGIVLDQMAEECGRRVVRQDRARMRMARLKHT